MALVEEKKQTKDHRLALDELEIGLKTKREWMITKREWKQIENEWSPLFSEFNQNGIELEREREKQRERFLEIEKRRRKHSWKEKRIVHSCKESIHEK